MKIEKQNESVRSLKENHTGFYIKKPSKKVCPEVSGNLFVYRQTLKQGEYAV